MKPRYCICVFGAALFGSLWLPQALAQVATVVPEVDATIILRPTIPAYFPGCISEAEGTDEKAQCSAGKLMSYISRTLRYPELAREEGVEGVVVLSFVITNQGDVEQVKVLRDIGAGCGDEAKRVVSEMPAWQPAIFKGDSVYTQFTLPITFGLKANVYDYVLHTGELPDGEVTRVELLDLIELAPFRVTNPKGAELPITEVIYTFERGGERDQLVMRGQEMPERRDFEKFLGRKPGRLSIEANVADGMDIRTVTKNFVVVR